MKTCGSCGEVYADDVASCTMDGAPLSSWTPPAPADSGASPATSSGDSPATSSIDAAFAALGPPGSREAADATLLNAQADALSSPKPATPMTPGARGVSSRPLTDPALGNAQTIAARTPGIGAAAPLPDADAATVRPPSLAPHPGGPTMRMIAPAAGRLLGGRYLLKKQIGVGGFGAVFEAEDRRLTKRVAVKVLSPQVAGNAETLMRFQREAIAASQIGHESIVDVTDFDRDPDGLQFIVMEYLDGRDLASTIATDGPLPPSRALVIAAQVAQALSAAHGKGILHRDLKPANVYLTARGGRVDYAKVLDFGISKVMHHSLEAGGLTATGQIIGTPFYMSPEQASGDRAIDGRTDVYSLGVILYEMVVKKPPFVGSTYLGVITQHLTREPVPPSRVMPQLDLSQELDTLILRALVKNPDARFQSMAEFHDEMLRVLGAIDPAAAAAVRPITAPVPQRRAISVGGPGLTPLPGPTPSGGAATMLDEPDTEPRIGPPTTLGRASGEMKAAQAAIAAINFRNEGVRRPAGGTGWKAAVAAIVLLGGGAAFWATRGSHGSQSVASTSPTTAPTISPTPVPAPTPARTPPTVEPLAAHTPPTVDPPRPAPARHVRVISDAAGAQVFAADGKTLLGPSPYEATPGDAGLALVVRAPGYQDQAVRVDASSPDELRVPLHHRSGGAGKAGPGTGTTPTGTPPKPPHDGPHDIEKDW